MPRNLSLSHIDARHYWSSGGGSGGADEKACKIFFFFFFFSHRRFWVFTGAAWMDWGRTGANFTGAVWTSCSRAAKDTKTHGRSLGFTGAAWMDWGRAERGEGIWVLSLDSCKASFLVDRVLLGMNHLWIIWSDPAWKWVCPIRSFIFGNFYMFVDNFSARSEIGFDSDEEEMNIWNFIFQLVIWYFIFFPYESCWLLKFIWICRRWRRDQHMKSWQEILNWLIVEKN